MNPVAKAKLKQWKQVYRVVEVAKKPKIKKSEQLSDREWKELMGQFNQTLGRHNGALRRRG